MQKLILPINNCKLTASWKTAAYYNRFGFLHYGIDLISTKGAADRKIWASGNGVVVATGRDNVVGNVVVVLYTNAVNSRTGKTQDVVIRYFHLASIAVSKWQKVTKDTVLGMYGATGSTKMLPHLHIEADSDVGYPLYSPTVSRASLIKGRAVGANDKTMSNPMEWLYCKRSKPDNQTYSTANDRFIRSEDRIIPNF